MFDSSLDGVSSSLSSLFITGLTIFVFISVADPGCLSLISDPNFSIPDPWSRVKKFGSRIRIRIKVFLTLKLFLSCGKIISDVLPGSGSRYFSFPHHGSRIWIPRSKKHRIPARQSQHWFLSLPTGCGHLNQIFIKRKYWIGLRLGYIFKHSDKG